MGSELSQLGKRANKTKGIDKERAKPNIPIIGSNNSPEAALTNTIPTKGPVQEKETNTNVSAIKKIPKYPPFDSDSALLFVHEEGNSSSNAPKKEAPKINNKTANPILK